MKCRNPHYSHNLSNVELATDKLDGYCVQCWNAGVPELVAKISVAKQAFVDIQVYLRMCRKEYQPEQIQQVIDNWSDLKDDYELYLADSLLLQSALDEQARLEEENTRLRAVVEPLEKLLPGTGVEIWRGTGNQFTIRLGRQVFGQGPTLAEALAAVAANQPKG